METVTVELSDVVTWGGLAIHVLGFGCPVPGAIAVLEFPETRAAPAMAETEVWRVMLSVSTPVAFASPRSKIKPEGHAHSKWHVVQNALYPFLVTLDLNAVTVVSLDNFDFVNDLFHLQLSINLADRSLQYKPVSLEDH